MQKSFSYITSKQSLIASNSNYPFGIKIQKRSYSATSYRFGFNGKELDNESFSGAIAFEARIYDSRLGRFLSRDPREADYAWQSTYAYYSNSPISKVDHLGMGKKGDKVKTGEGPLEYAERNGLTGTNLAILDQLAINNPTNFYNYNSNMTDKEKTAYWSDGSGKNWNIDPGQSLVLSDGERIGTHPEETAQKPNIFDDIKLPEPNADGKPIFFKIIGQTDEIIAGAHQYTKGLKNGGGHIVLSTAKTGKGLYWKPNARGLNNLKGASINVSKALKYGGPIIGAALEIPEIVDGFKQSPHEGSTQVAGAVGSVGGGWFGGLLAGAGIGACTTWETGPGVVIGVIIGAGLGAYYGEEGVEYGYDKIFGN